MLATARSYIGTKEIPGKQHNPTILKWLREQGRNLGDWGKRRDESAWCSVFVGGVLAEHGIEGTGHALAKSWATWGKPAKFTPGAILVLRRKRKAGANTTGSGRGGFHVTFIESVNKHWYKCTGGNQKDQVCTASYAKSKYEVIAVRTWVQ